MPEIVRDLEQADFENRSIKIYNGIRLLFEGAQEKTEVDQDELFDRLMEWTRDEHVNISPEESMEILSLLGNFCLYKINRENKPYLWNLFSINNEIVNLQFRSKDRKRKVLQYSLYKNMVVAAINLKGYNFSKIETCGILPEFPEKGFQSAYEWADKFIEHYKSKLDKSSHNIYYPYCKALLEFNRERYIRAYRILYNSKGIRGLFINMHMKILYLKVIYEIYSINPRILRNDSVEINKVLESFRGLLRDEVSRKKRLAYHVYYFENFLLLYRQLFNLYGKYSGQLYNSKNPAYLKDKQKLHKAIVKNPYRYRKWLMEKLDEIT